MNKTARETLTDGLAGDQQEVVRGAYSVVGATTPLAGKPPLGAFAVDCHNQTLVVLAMG